jgi:N-acetylneuraminate synthase
VVSIKDIYPGEMLSKKNIWVKRPGTGHFKASDYYKLLGKKTKKLILKNNFIKKNDI